MTYRARRSATVDHELLAPLRDDPAASAILCDFDGTLAAIAARPDLVEMPPPTRRSLRVLARRYRLVGFVSGRPAAQLRDLVAIPAATYVGLHGLEEIGPGDSAVQLAPEVSPQLAPVQDLLRQLERGEANRLGLRFEDKGPVFAIHWRGADDLLAAAELARRIGAEARDGGLATRDGRMVLEVGPAVAINKGSAVERLLERVGARRCLYAGDDLTDLDAFTSLGGLLERGQLDHLLLVAVESAEGPEELARRADLVLSAPAGMAELLGELAR